MDTDAQFRQAQPTDAAAMLAVKRAAIWSLSGSTYGDDQLSAWAPDGDDLRAFEASPDADQYVVRVALVEGSVVAYGALHVPEARIDALYVDPAHEGAGLATTLCRQLETSARFSGLERLSVIAATTATGFYERLGYEQVDSHERTIDGEPLRFAVMERPLRDDGADGEDGTDGNDEADGDDDTDG